MYLIKYFESKFNYNTSSEIIEDLVQFQIFLISHYDDPEIKSENFQYDWKTFFNNRKSLAKTSKKYFYKKQIDEKDKILWGWIAVFTGRPSRKYKFDPERLQEGELELKISQVSHKS